MSIVVEVIFVSILVYRISTDIAEMSGPFEIFEWLRGYTLTSKRISPWVADGISCPICISFWLACIIALVTWRWEYLVSAGVTRLIIDWRNKE